MEFKIKKTIISNDTQISEKINLINDKRIDCFVIIYRFYTYILQCTLELETLVHLIIIFEYNYFDIILKKY